MVIVDNSSINGHVYKTNTMVSGEFTQQTTEANEKYNYNKRVNRQVKRAINDFAMQHQSGHLAVEYEEPGNRSRREESKRKVQKGKEMK